MNVFGIQEGEWLLHCRKMENMAADCSVLYAASILFKANIHIIYIHRDRRFTSNEYIIYYSAVGSSKNLYLGYLGEQRYVSLSPAIGSQLYDGLESDTRLLKHVLDRQTDAIRFLESTLKETKELVVSTTEASTQADDTTLKDEIQRLNKKIEDLQKELEEAKREKKMIEERMGQNQDEFQEEMKRAKEKEKIMKRQHKENLCGLKAVIESQIKKMEDDDSSD